MSFFDNTKIVGWMLFVIGILSLIDAIIQIVNGATSDGGIVDNIGYVIAGLGALIGALILFGFGNKVRVGAVSSKLAIVAGFVKTIGAMTVVSGIFGIIGGIIVASSNWGVLGGGVICLILGLIILFFGGKIDDGKNTGFDKILWVILVVIFAILMVSNLFAIGGGVLDIISAVCGFIMYLFILVFMFDKEIKKAML